MIPRSLHTSFLAILLCLSLIHGCHGIEGDHQSSETSSRNTISAEQSHRREKSKSVRKQEDEMRLQAAKHAHGDHDCELEVTFITPDYFFKTGSPKDIRLWENGLAKASRDDLELFGTLELKRVEVDRQAIIPVDADDPKHRKLLKDLPHWYEKYYDQNLYWGFNRVYFWSDLGTCRNCDNYKNPDWVGNRKRNLRQLGHQQLTEKQAAAFAQQVFTKFQADKTNAWMNDLVYLHVKGDCGPGLKIDAIYKRPLPKDVPLIVDGAT